MSRRWLLSLVCFSAVLFLLNHVSSASYSIRVNESATRVFLKELAPEVSLVLENGSKQPVSALIRLELLKPNNTVSATAERRVELKSGRQNIQFTLPYKSRKLTPEEESDILWYRLRYQVTPDNSPSIAAGGIVSISEITPDLFDIQVVGPRLVIPGQPYMPRVRAAHPVTHRPVKNVQIKGLVKTYDSESNSISLTSSALTDDNGYAELNFKVPEGVDDAEFDVEVEGTLGLVTVEAHNEVSLSNRKHVVVSTDKPLYQPGQTLYARVLMFGPSRRALPDKSIDLKITDPEDTVVYSSSLITSRFGIASAEWKIPDTTRLGDYRLEFSNEDHDTVCSAVVKISRYDLPTFAVKLKTDRPYYQPGQKAQVEVKADYLFGEPVKRGHVRLVRETERTWNYREQKYDIEEGDKYEGDTVDGSFKAELDLTKDYEELTDEDYRRFTDIPYTAYFTDPSTNRTEQRRLNIRISKDAIHIYVIRPRDSYSENRHLPLEFFVSTFYADGSPAPSKVSIRLAGTEEQPGRVVQQVKTNQYGIAKISQLKLADDELKEDRLELEMEAEDKEGKKGTHGETISLGDQPTIIVTTNKSLFAPNEPIQAMVTSTVENLQVVLSVGHEGTVIDTRQLQLRKGPTSIVLPYKPEYQDELTISAFAENPDDDSYRDFIWGARTVLYPRKKDLNVNLNSLAKTYRPGDLAHVKFQATSAEGRALESALGVVITDTAVDERVRTDREFGSSYGGFYGELWSLMGFGDSIGSITRKSLEQINVGRPVPADLALVAEALLNQGHSFDTEPFGRSEYQLNQAAVFGPHIAAQLDPSVKALNKFYKESLVYPKDDSSLRRLLSQAGIDFASLRDPWNQSYRTDFRTELDQDVLTIMCAGADKQFDTSDDFSVARVTRGYFKPIGEAIDRAVNNYHQRTGKYILDFETLRNELRNANRDLDTLRDPWNQPYNFSFDVNGTNYRITVTTTQPSRNNPGGFRFTPWTSSIDYFAKSRWDIDAALQNYVKQRSLFPGNERELHDALLPAGMDTDALRDPWGRPYYLVFASTAFYGDKVTVENRADYQATATQQVTIRPVTKRAKTLRIRSAGADGAEGTSDDFQVGFFSAVVSEQSASDVVPNPMDQIVSLKGSTGAVKGTVLDPVGAVIPNARITARLQDSEQAFEETTDENGRFLFRNLPAGLYEVRASVSGFKDTIISRVLVRSSELVELNFTLEVGTVSEVVTVVSDASALQTAQATVGTSVTARKMVFLSPGVAAAKQQLATPRVREYFPETLLWQPQLTTDKKGRAQLDFKIADNITTWRMSVIGSTETGELGMAETEFRAFQPFFADLDPPRILTEGDRIDLPVVLRNYLDKKQTVDVRLKPQNWFKVLDSTQKQTEVAGGDFKNEAFSIQTVASVKDGKQQITAIGSDFSDAIEKPVTVHPDGEERAETVSDLIDSTTDMSINLPANTIANSARVELKVYPNLMTHVFESVEAIMQRPYGCGEQTISSTYPSLLVLRYLKDQKEDSPVAEKARRYLDLGYQRLLGYQSMNGGFSYWGDNKSDIALTAYALRFLKDASAVMDIDSEAAERARQWLISQQRSDGSWPALNWKNEEDLVRTAMVTAVVTRSLALTEPTTTSKSQEPTALNKSINYLDRQISGIDEPYLISCYSLAASVIGDQAGVERANTRLKALAHSEGTRTYWSLETNTPFYGWGLAGRVETTALVVEALARQKKDDDQEKRRLQARGLLFLLRNKDRYGVWYSTQATINVLDAMLSLMSPSTEKQTAAPGSLAIIVNGQPVKPIDLPSDSRMVAPLTLDLSAMVKTGNTRIEFRRTGGGPPISLQVVNTYYVPWGDRTEQGRVRSADAESLLLETSFDKMESKVAGEITCKVKAERIGFRGYGMLLAEIGLPPGADVDRESLEKAKTASNWGISQYDVLPDRVVVYLWPRAGGSEFSFKFRPRLAMTAKSAASSVYDYYNPEAKAVVAPATFVVK